jgi:hypothetical protein
MPRTSKWREAPPDLWRRFALGERGGAIAGLAGLDDIDLVERTAGRLRADAMFRDAGHHFLRQFDALLEEIAPRADDEVIRLMTDTRSARAYMSCSVRRSAASGRWRARPDRARSAARCRGVGRPAVFGVLPGARPGARPPRGGRRPMLAHRGR